MQFLPSPVTTPSTEIQYDDLSTDTLVDSQSNHDLIDWPNHFTSHRKLCWPT